jgi:hypothetical protein
MLSLSAARGGMARALDAYLLRDRERDAARRSPLQQEEIARYFQAAKRRSAAADALGEPCEAVVATILYRDAALLLVAALGKANDTGAAFPGTAVEAREAFDRLTLDLDRREDNAENLNLFRSALRSDDPLVFDKLAPADLVGVRAAAQEVVSWLRARLDPRPVTQLRATRRLRVAAWALGLAALACFSLSALFSTSNVARGKPTFASSQYPGTPPATGATNGQVEPSYGAHTNVEDEPWIRVDLEKPYAVKEVRVYNRADGWVDEGLPLVLEFSLDGSAWKEIDRRTTPYSQAAPWIAKAHRARARYVRLRVPRHGYIAISEIEVFA